jgi:hypothetical protein
LCRQNTVQLNIRPSIVGLNSTPVASAAGSRLGAWLVPWPVTIRRRAGLVAGRGISHARAARSGYLAKGVRGRFSLAHPATDGRGQSEEALTAHATVQGGLYGTDGRTCGHTGITKLAYDPQSQYGTTRIPVCRREITDPVRRNVVFRCLSGRIQNLWTGTRAKQTPRGHQSARIPFDRTFQPGTANPL